jgi:hypothetical protein
VGVSSPTSSQNSYPLIRPVAVSSSFLLPFPHSEKTDVICSPSAYKGQMSDLQELYKSVVKPLAV